MANSDNKTQGGSHEQHVKAGEQSHKNDEKSTKGAGGSSSGGSQAGRSGGNDQSGSKKS